MKYSLNLLLRSGVISLVFLGFASAGVRKTISLVPSNGKSVIILLEGKEKEYYLIDRRGPLHVQIDGPGKLTVTTRLSGAAKGT